MNPLIFQFREEPTEAPFDLSFIEYDESLGLNINKKTGDPAIWALEEGTETFTRSNEDSDTDNNLTQTLVNTETATKTHGEGVDSDLNSLALSMATATTTASPFDESSDVDRGPF